MGDFKSKYTGQQIETVLDHAANLTTFTIKDTYATLSALKAAFPTGNEFAYQVEADMNVYIWSNNATDWVSVGKIQGQDGKTAYQSAVDGGYTGTEAEFNTILATAQSQIGTLSSLNTTDKTSVVNATNEVNTKVGSLATLTTTEKSSAVGAINEINSKMLIGTSDPTASTVGTLGQLYKNTTNGKIFKCTTIVSTTYTWLEIPTTETYALQASDMLNGWTAWAGVYYPIICKSGKLVSVSSGVVLGASPSANQVIFNIPSKFRPNSTKPLTATCSDKKIPITILSNGNAFLDTSGFTSLPSANQICFIDFNYNID